MSSVFCMGVHSLSPAWQLHKSSRTLNMFKDRWGAPSWQNISHPHTITQRVPWLAAAKYRHALALCIPQHLMLGLLHKWAVIHCSLMSALHGIHHIPLSFIPTLLPCSLFLGFVAHTLLVHNLGIWELLHCKCQLFKFWSHSKGLKDS